jgi:hypothetical protein
VDAGFEEGEPDEGADGEVGGEGLHVAASHGEDRGESEQGGEEPAGGEVAGVEDGDDDDGADVVGDGQGEQEDLGGEWDPGAEEGDDADGEGDVGGHGDAPAVGAGAAGVEGPEDAGGDGHAAEGGDDGKGDRAEVLELAVDRFALDLQSDEQEENGHEGVVDPGLEAEVVEVEQVAELDAQWGGPQVGVALRPGRVGPGDGDDRGDEHDDAAGGLVVEEPLERTDHGPGDEAVGLGPGVAHRLAGGRGHRVSSARSVRRRVRWAGLRGCRWVRRRR